MQSNSKQNSIDRNDSYKLTGSKNQLTEMILNNKSGYAHVTSGEHR